MKKSKKIEKALSIIRRPNLTRGQKDLYDLITIKLDAGKMIMYVEAKNIYIQKVCQQVRNGIPYTWNAWAEKYTDDKGEIQFKGAYQPMTDFELNQRVLLWLTSNIGALVLKGYLKVIPMIEIKRLL